MDEVGLWNPGAFEKYYLPNAQRFLTYGEPRRMNARLIAQSGTFVAPSTLAESVDQIAALLTSVEVLVKLRLRKPMRREALRQLYAANITNATLFPGLDGLARSLAFELETHWAFDPITAEEFPEH